MLLSGRVGGDLGLRPLITDLRERLRNPSLRAYGKLLRGITEKAGKKNAFSLESREFNLAAEQFYRQELKQKLIKEAVDCVRQSIRHFQDVDGEAVRLVLDHVKPAHFLNQIEHALLNDELTPEQLRIMISLVLLVIRWETGDSDGSLSEDHSPIYAEPSIHRSAYAAGA